jgi:hypothetical protein
MNRRDAVFTLFVLGAAPFIAVAQQQAKIFRIGFLDEASRPESLASSSIRKPPIWPVSAY